MYEHDIYISFFLRYPQPHHPGYIILLIEL